MKAIIQMLGSGETRLVEVPPPLALSGTLVIASRRSLISTGTERMLVNFARASLLQKARQQPDRVRQVLDKVRTDGLVTTLEAVRSKLDQPLSLGYSNAGIVVDVGAGVSAFKLGDRVVSNGSHAEIIRVPANLCAPIPDEVDDETACFAVVGAIGLEGVRLANPTLGESVVVIGLGLVGLMTVQILKANGCHVLGMDLDEDKLALARTLGVATHDPQRGGDPVAAALQFTLGVGADAVIVAASTDSSAPIRDAARMCRKRGRVILVGVTGLELDRTDFYEKELSFQVSCSYGPGRYDPAYEQRGQDYPLGFVRWTAQRNFEAILSLMATKSLVTAPLVSRRLDFGEALAAYEFLSKSPAAIGIVLSYPGATDEALAKRSVALAPSPAVRAKDAPVIGWIGAGNYGSRILIPAFKAAGARFDTIVTTGGVAGVHNGRAAGFLTASNDPADVFGHAAVDTVVIATRHDTHAQFVIDALGSGRHVFVEKPLALSLEEVDRVEAAWRAAAAAGKATHLMVGFNRRFAPQVTKMRELLLNVGEPVAFVYTCNAGAIPAGHWASDADIGGGRILGEACHFVDLLRHLAGARIVETQVIALGNARNAARRDDSALISLRFENGSVGTIQYLANGGTRFPKERLEVFAGGAVLRLDNFRVLRGFGWRGFRRSMLWRQDKGQQACAAAFLASIRQGGAPPIPIGEIWEVARTTIEIAARHRSAAASQA